MNLLTHTLDGASNTSGGGGNFSMIFIIVIYVLIFGALYFFLIRPNSKKKKEEAELRNSIEIGDEITTIGGIMGRVIAIKEDEDAIIIESGSDRVKMKMKRWCVSTVDTQKDAAANKPAQKKGLFSGLFKKKDKDSAENEKKQENTK